MYKGGKLTAAARAKLEKRYAKERAKDSILAKIDSQTKRKPKKKQIKTKNRIVQTKQVSIGKPVAVKEETEAVDQFDVESECPSTPPRNDMVNERKAIMQQNAGVNWISFVEHIQVEAKAENNLCATLENKSQKAFKQSLEGEMKIRELQRKKEREEIINEQKREQELYKKWEEEDVKKATMRHAKVEELKKMRMDQIGSLNEKRRQYAKKELRRDQRAFKRAQEEKEAHERELLEKKKAHYAMMETVLKENVEHKKVVEAQRIRDADEDICLQKMYVKMLEDQEKARSDRLAATYAQAEKKVASLLDCTAEERRKEREADEHILRERTERQRQEDEKTRLKAERRRRENLEVQAYLAEQIRLKEEKLRKEKENDLRLGKKLAEEAKKSLESDEAKVEKRKQIYMETSSFICQQINDNEERRVKQRADMNENEKQFNSSLIRKIESGESDVKEPKADPNRPFAWRYNYRSKPF